MSHSQQFAAHLAGRMSLDQKVGALLTLGYSGTTLRREARKAICDLHCGGLRVSPGARFFGDYVDPETGKVVVKLESPYGFKKGVQPPLVTRSEYKALLDEFQGMALARPLGLPLHFSWDHEGGGGDNSNIQGIGQYPNQMGLRATGDPRLAREVARSIAIEGRAIGFSFIHSPILDVNVNPRNPEVYCRAYSDRAEEVAEYAEQSCIGFREGGMVATGKHFPGRGDSDQDPHYRMPVVEADRDTMMNRDLLPYRHLIEKGLLPSVMLAHSIYPAFDEKEVATVSKKIVTGLLREELGFEGVVTTDSMTMAGVAVRYGVAEACAMSVEAGADLVLMKAETSLMEETFEAIKRRVESGAISEAELDRKVCRILSLKHEYGFFRGALSAQEPPEAVARRAGIDTLRPLLARRSVLVGRDREGLLPLAPTGRLLVVEQLTTRANDAASHQGMLFEAVARHAPDARYVETATAADGEDRQRIRNALDHCDTAIMTNYYTRGATSNLDTIREVAAAGKRLVLVASAPYTMAVPDEAGTVVVTFSRAPENLHVVADVLFGAATADGVWPIEYRMPD